MPYKVMDRLFACKVYCSVKQGDKGYRLPMADNRARSAVGPRNLGHISAKLYQRRRLILTCALVRMTW
jgi:hypothetical protein